MSRIVTRCPTCHRRRWVFRDHSIEFAKRTRVTWRCSKGHTWTSFTLSSRQLGQLFKSIYADGIAAQLNAPNPLKEFLSL